MAAPFRITGVIGDEFRAADLQDFLAAAGGAPVAVLINSPGGSVFEGLSAYNALAEYEGLVTVTVDALAASAASLIFMGGDRRVMLEGSMVMIHRSSGLTAGDKNAHEKTADVLAKIDQQVIGIYSKVSGLSTSRVKALLDDETWMDAKQAVDLGFATEASVDAISAQIAGFDLTKFRNPPARLVAMAQQKDPPMTVNNPNPAPRLDPFQPTAPVVGETRAIFEMCSGARLTMEETASVIEKANGDRDKAKDLVINLIADRAGDQTFTPSGGDSLANPDTLAQAVSETLYARMSGKPVPKGPAEGLAGRSLLDLGAMLIEANGGKIKSWHRDRLAQQVLMSGGQHSTSDFPFLTTDAGNRVLAEAYVAAGSPLKQVARRRSAQDFRSLAVGRLGEMPALLEVPEGGEVTYGSRTESHEAFRLRTFSRIFSITRQALINDDLSAFSDSVRAWGQAAASVEANELYALVAGDGVVMEDGKTLWHADHGNVAGSAAQLSITSLDEARAAIRTTKGLDGVTPLSMKPRFLVVGPLNESRGQVIVNASASFVATTIEAANPFASTLELLVEPRIEDYSWMLFSDPALAEVLAFAHLGDRTGPELETRDGWTTLGSEFRAVLDFGCGATSYRGAYKNEGEAPTP